MAIDPVALKAEIINDPKSIGYATPWNAGSNQEVADLLNAVREICQVDVAYREAWELQNAVVYSEQAALDATRMTAWQNVLRCGRVEVRNSNMRGQILGIWVAGTTTRSNLAELQTRDSSRAEELWGDGVTVSLDDVRAAREV